MRVYECNLTLPGVAGVVVVVVDVDTLAVDEVAVDAVVGGGRGASLLRQLLTEGKQSRSGPHNGVCTKTYTVHITNYMYVYMTRLAHYDIYDTENLKGPINKKAEKTK